MIPESALTDRRSPQEGAEGERARIFVVSGSSVSEREIVLGELTERGRVVVRGLAEKEVVVDRPEGDLKEGERVAIAE